MSGQYPYDLQFIINDLLKEDSQEFWQSIQNTPVYAGIRFNSLKKGYSRIKDQFPIAVSPLPWEKEGYLVDEGNQLGKHPFHTCGLFYLQEPSAMVPVSILDPQPGELILDLCAAPGGKTTQILSRMKNQGWLLANDSNPQRIQALIRNVDRWGTRNTAVTNETPDRLADHFGAIFDRVLIDAPCSGEGTFRTDPRAVKKWSINFMNRSAVIQDDILWHGAKLVRPGGKLVYSTCTFNQHENEGTISRFLSRNKDFILEKIPFQAGFQPGIPLKDHVPNDFSKTVRIWPHHAPGEGHFIALLRRKGQKLKSKIQDQNLRRNIPNNELTAYQEFFHANMYQNSSTESIHPGSENIQVYGNQLYWTSPLTPQLDGLRVKYWGWRLGTFKNDAIIPSPGLVAALPKEDFQKVLEFSVDDPDLKLYQRGSPIYSNFKGMKSDGWVVIAVEGFPFGWGKLSKGKIKSYLPKWLRR